MAEDSVRSGRDGEKIAREILKLIGWGSTSWNLDIDCSFPSRHKPDNKTKNWHHGIDILYSYDNPLYHDRRDVIIGSVKHSEKGYPTSKKSDINKFIQDLAIDLDCSKASDDILKLVGNSSLKTHYKGVLFWLSSLETEQEYDLLQHISHDIDFGTNQFEEIFVVDNKRATFLVSCVKTAERYMPSSKIKFLYQNTGKNMDKSQLLISGEKLPVQLINSEVIPMVKEGNGKISCLIFCNNPYNKENASRLIWLSHKLCGLTNEIRIYLPVYDNNKEYEVNAIKQLFKDESFTTKISFHRFSKFDFVSLKESQESYSFLEIPEVQPKTITHSVKISDDIDKILPYGDFLLPKLKTSILSDVNLREFLLRKGVVTLKQTKNEILPVFSCLLLSPIELDSLKAKYREKEDKPKEIERKAKVNIGDKTLWETFNTYFPNLKTITKTGLPNNCTIEDNPTLERVDSNYNHLILKFRLEKENTNKDFLTGKSYHDAQIEIKYKKNEIKFVDKHTSADTYKMTKKYFDNFEKALKKNNMLIEDFKSIKFLDFDNNKRIQFLLSFLQLRDSKQITIKKMSLENMKFRADDTLNSIPEDLESLKGRVSNLNLYGKELNETIYLSEELYRESILCEKVKFGITYNYLNRSGICYMEVTFAGALGVNGYKDTELQISVTPSNNTFDTNFTSTKSFIVKEINQIKESNYNRFKQTSNTDASI